MALGAMTGAVDEIGAAVPARLGQVRLELLAVEREFPAPEHAADLEMDPVVVAHLPRTGGSVFR